jgi:hypothetical protein
MNEHTANWREIRELLLEARNCLAPDTSTQDSAAVPVGLLTGTLDEFMEFLDQNELELAWDSVAKIAERNGAQPTCWSKLARAASLMRLSAKEELAAQRARPTN